MAGVSSGSSRDEGTAHEASPTGGSSQAGVKHSVPSQPASSQSQPARSNSTASLSIVFSAAWVRLTTPIGEGAFSRVYEAVYRNPETLEESIVAVKILKRNMLKRRSDCLRFIKEAKIMTRISHRNIAACYGIGKYEDDDPANPGCLFIVQELVHGGNLLHRVYRQMLNRARCVYTSAEALRWMIDVAAGMAYLHSVADGKPMIIHRDLKLENIMLARHQNGNTTAKLVDFGLHKVIDERIKKVVKRVISEASLGLNATRHSNGRRGLGLGPIGGPAAAMDDELEAALAEQRAAAAAMAGLPSASNSQRITSPQLSGGLAGPPSPAGLTMQGTASLASPVEQMAYAFTQQQPARHLQFGAQANGHVASTGALHAMQQQQQQHQQLALLASPLCGSRPAVGSMLSGPMTLHTNGHHHPTATAAAQGQLSQGFVGGGFVWHAQNGGHNGPGVHLPQDPGSMQHLMAQMGLLHLGGAGLGGPATSRPPSGSCVLGSPHSGWLTGANTSPCGSTGLSGMALHLSGVEGVQQLQPQRSASGQLSAANVTAALRAAGAAAAPSAAAAAGAGQQQGSGPRSDPGGQGAAEALNPAMAPVPANYMLQPSNTLYMLPTQPHLGSGPQILLQQHSPVVSGNAAFSPQSPPFTLLLNTQQAAPQSGHPMPAHALHRTLQQQASGGACSSAAPPAQSAAGVAADGFMRPPLAQQPNNKHHHALDRVAAAQGLVAMHAAIGTSGGGPGGLAQGLAGLVPADSRFGLHTRTAAPQQRLPPRRAVTMVTEIRYNLTEAVGSWAYMAPEVVLGQPYNEKVDVFSFGVILYEVLSRKLMLADEIKSDPRRDAQAYAERVARGFRPEIPLAWPEPLRMLITACWAQDPHCRPNFAAIVDALAELDLTGAVARLDLAYWNTNAVLV